MEEIYFKVLILERMLGEISLNNKIAKEVCNLATDTKSFQNGFTAGHLLLGRHRLHTIFKL